MADTILRPNSTRRNDGFKAFTASTSTSSTTSADVLTAVSDTATISGVLMSNPDTYVQKPTTGGSLKWWGSIADPASALPAAGDFVAKVTVRCKMSQASTGYVETRLFTTDQALAVTGTFAGSVGTSHGRTVTFYQRTGTTAKLTTSGAHGLTTNDYIVVENVLAALNGAYKVTAVPTSTTVEYTTATSATVSQTPAASTAVVSEVVDKDAIAYTCPNTTDGLWTSTRINDLSVFLTEISTSVSQNGRPRIYGLETIVTTSALPAFGAAPTISNATGTTATSRPTVNLGAYSQTDSYPQNGVQVRVFTGTGSATITNPLDSSTWGSAILVWDSGTLGNVSTVQIGTDLVHNTTYYVYVRCAADASGAGTQQAWSAWGSGTATSTANFTLSLQAPTDPTWAGSPTTPTWSSTTQAVTLTINASAYANGTQVAEIQRSNDNGVTWYPVRGASALAVAGSPLSATAVDYEAAKGTSGVVKYRARMVGTHTNGQRVTSGWVTTSAVTTTVTNGGGWTLRSFSATALVNQILNARVLADPELVREESVGVFRPLGRTTPVVIHGDLEGADGSWVILAEGSTEWGNLTAVINSQRIILVMDPFGGYRHIRITDRSWTQQGTFDNPRYQMRVSYVEVGTDLTAAS